MDAPVQKVRICGVCGGIIEPHVDRRNTHGNIRNRKVCDRPECIAAWKKQVVANQYIRSVQVRYVREIERTTWTGFSLMRLGTEQFARVVTAILNGDGGFVYEPMSHTYQIDKKPADWITQWAEDWTAGRDNHRIEEARVLSRGGKIGQTKAKY